MDEEGKTKVEDDHDATRPVAVHQGRWVKILVAAVFGVAVYLVVGMSGLTTRIIAPTTLMPPPAVSVPTTLYEPPVIVAGNRLELGKGQGIEFVVIPAGRFRMGSANVDEDERPFHLVTLSRGFELGKYEVTQGQWETVMGSNPSYFKKCGKDCPVEQVSWHDAQKFLEKLNNRRDGYRYRLPTEAEWEYAARAGTTGDYAGNLDEMAWYGGNSGGVTHQAGQKRSNAWGLYDMHGNVWEWCQDWFGQYPSGSVVDPTGPATGEDRVYRGGSWISRARFCRSAIRYGGGPGRRDYDMGCRLARVSLK